MTSEVYPVIKTGGLADVSAALPAALRTNGYDARILMPGYPAVLAAAKEAEVVYEDANLFEGGPARILAASITGIDVPTYVLESKGLFGRNGNPYVDAQGLGWSDNHLRFGALSWAGATLGLGLDPTFVPDIVHAHDWQAALAPAHLFFAGSARPRTLITIHNLAYQGWFPKHVFPHLGLPAAAFHVDGLEFHDGVSFMKGGLYYSDRIGTVSKTYAQEIQGREQGYGLEGLLSHRKRDLVGIVNGVDYGVWEPSRDPHVPARYDVRSIDKKLASKRTLQQRFGLEVDDDAPLFGLVSRLTWHKGIDLVVQAVPTIVEQRAQLALLGSGDPTYEYGLSKAQADHPGRIAVQLGYDEALSHLVQAGADVILVPSRLEPCGLTQMYALRYGSLPLVRRTGGLADTVVNADPEALLSGRATGFVFEHATAEALSGTIAWACRNWQDRAQWRRMQRTAMAQDFGWAHAAKKYIEVYEGLR